jgi:predicted DNA repair protein MutK
MAAGSLLALLDDIATVLDDVALLTKVAATKTAGVLGDDLALNAQQVAGVSADRELPVVWAVARGSLLNKAILVPLALALSTFAPWAVTPALMLGGAYLCFEGFEKIAHELIHGKDDTRREALSHALADLSVDLVAFEKEKIKGAVRTDFILSAEIIVISLGTVAGEPFATRFAVLTAIAVLMTAGVYGLVAGIVKLDDAGMWLCRGQGEGAGVKARKALGSAILCSAPWLMKGLSWAGLAAMFLVGGSILVHGVPALHHWIDAVAGSPGGFTATLASLLADGAVGILTGAIAVGAATAGRKAIQRAQAH